MGEGRVEHVQRLGAGARDTGHLHLYPSRAFLKRHGALTSRYTGSA